MFLRGSPFSILQVNSNFFDYKSCHQKSSFMPPSMCRRLAKLLPLKPFKGIVFRRKRKRFMPCFQCVPQSSGDKRQFHVIPIPSVIEAANQVVSGNKEGSNKTSEINCTPNTSKTVFPKEGGKCDLYANTAQYLPPNLKEYSSGMH